MRHPGVRPEILRPRPSRPPRSVLGSPMLRTAVFALRHVVPVVILRHPWSSYRPAKEHSRSPSFRAPSMPWLPHGPIGYFLSGDGGRRPAVQDSPETATGRPTRYASTRTRGGSRGEDERCWRPEGFTFLSISDRLRACSGRTWVSCRHARDVAGRAGVSSIHASTPSFLFEGS